MKLRIGLSLILLLLFSSLFAQNEEIVTLSTQTGDIEGTLLIPETDKTPPVALIITGSGPTDRNGNNPMMTNNSLKMLATDLNKNGIASLRYDKRGVAKSRNDGFKESDFKFEHLIQDAKDWIALLNQDDRYSDIIVIGHSEGSLIGMIASQDANVSKFISIEGAGQTVDKLIKSQLESQPPMVLEKSLPILDKLVHGETVENVPTMLNSLFRPSVQPYLISWFKYDPQIEIAKLKIPVLIIQGTTDIQVNVDEAERLANANQKAVIKMIEGMNHIMKVAELERQKNIQTYYQPELPLADGLVKSIVDFID